MTVIYTIWLVIAGLLWIFFLFLERKKIRDHILKPKIESIDDLGTYIQKVINVGLGFPSAAITWPLWIPVLVLILGTSLLWDDYLKPYLDEKLFPPKSPKVVRETVPEGNITTYTGTSGGAAGTTSKAADDQSGVVMLQAGAPDPDKEINLEGCMVDNRKPEEKGHQTLSTTGEGGSLDLPGGGTSGTGTLSPTGDLFLNKVEEADSAVATKGAKAVGEGIHEIIERTGDPVKNFEESKEDQEDPPPAEEKDDFYENANELDVSQTTKDEDPKEK